MDPRMMRQWLAAQAKKTQITEAQMQRKRLGISEEVTRGLPPDEFYPLNRIKKETGYGPSKFKKQSESIPPKPKKEDKVSEDSFNINNLLKLYYQNYNPNIGEPAPSGINEDSIPEDDYATALASGSITPNEYRRLMGDEERDESEVTVSASKPSSPAGKGKPAPQNREPYDMLKAIEEKRKRGEPIPSLPDFTPQPKVGIIKNLLDIRENLGMNVSLFGGKGTPMSQQSSSYNTLVGPEVGGPGAGISNQSTKSKSESNGCSQCDNITDPNAYNKCISDCSSKKRKNSPEYAPTQRELARGKETQARMNKLHNTATSANTNLAEGVVPQAAANSKAGMHATAAATMPQFRSSVSQHSAQNVGPADQCESCKKYHPATADKDCWKVCGGNPPAAKQAPRNLKEQLSPHEEIIAKKMKPALQNMIDQYGEEKGTRVFYGTVRNLAKKDK